MPENPQNSLLHKHYLNVHQTRPHKAHQYPHIHDISLKAPVLPIPPSESSSTPLAYAERQSPAPYKTPHPGDN